MSFFSVFLSDHVEYCAGVTAAFSSDAFDVFCVDNDAGGFHG